MSRHAIYSTPGLRRWQIVNTRSTCAIRRSPFARSSRPSCCNDSRKGRNSSPRCRRRRKACLWPPNDNILGPSRISRPPSCSPSQRRLKERERTMRWLEEGEREASEEGAAYSCHSNAPGYIPTSEKTNDGAMEPEPRPRRHDSQRMCQSQWVLFWKT